MKQKFTTILMAFVVAVMSLGFSSCDDEKADQMNGLKDVLQQQIDELKDENATLKDALANIKECHCGDVNKLIADAIAEHLKNNPHLTTGDVNQIIEDYLKNHPQGLTEAEVRAIVTEMTINLVTKDELESAVNKLDSAISVAEDAIAKNSHSIDSLATALVTVNTIASQAAADASAALALAEKNTNSIDSLSNILSMVQLTVTGIKNLVLEMNTKVNEALLTSNRALALAEADSILINQLTDAYEDLATRVDNHDIQIANLEDSVDMIIEKLNDFATHDEVAAVLDSARSYYAQSLAYTDSVLNVAMTQMYNYVDSTAAAITAAFQAADQLLQDQIDDLQDKIDELQDQIDELRDDLDELTATVIDAFSKMITSIVLQGSTNPVFGSFALPMGIKSNMLVAYYGENEHTTYFPTVSTSDLVYEEYALTEKDAQMLGSVVDSESIPGQTTFINTNAGKLYLTVNPVAADLSTTEFTLVNSLGEECGVTLDSIVPSTDKLTFGYTKAPAIGKSANGFYEATATLTEDNIDAVKVNIDPALKSIAKDAMLNPSNVDFAQVANAIYEQFNGILDANAVQATWTDSLGEHSVISEYGIAATAVKPLSYSFLYGYSIGGNFLEKLPTLSPINELNADELVRKINEKVNISLDFKVNLKIAESQIKITFDSIKFDEYGDLYVWATKNDGAALNEGEWYLVETVVKDIEKEINAKKGTWSADASRLVKQCVDNLINEINTQAVTMGADLSAQANKKIQDVLNDVARMSVNAVNKYIPMLNQFINLYNKLYNRVLGALSNVNGKLQVALVYEGADGAHHFMSNSKAIPTVFEGSGAYVLYPTSYNAEFLAPAYKKFVGVTNVFKGNASAQDGDSACKAELDAVNASEYFDTVLDGGRFGIAFTPKSGFTYEIFYAGLDYYGKISQRKFYVTVK